MAFQSSREEIVLPRFIDYKNVAFLRQFTSPHAKMLGRKRTGVSAQKQREIALAIKRARYMALLPYLSA